MMREILFRGKRIDNGEWVYGYYTYCTDGCKLSHRIYIVFAEAYGGETLHSIWFEVIPTSVGQFTNLYDKNDKKIFEGDIFKFPDEAYESYYTSCGTEYNSREVENYGVVGFCEDLARFDFVEYKFSENVVDADLHENHDLEFYDFISDLKVIGNIHDNPELLKGGAE